MNLNGEGGKAGVKEEVIEYMLHESKRKDCLGEEMEPRVVTRSMDGKEDI